MIHLKPLTKDFVPGDHDVVINKGKRFFHHKGNAWLREIATSMIEEYSSARSKLDKSMIISDVVEHVRINGNFVKRHGSQWNHAEDLLCREKTSAVFRDALQQQQRETSPTLKTKERGEGLEGLDQQNDTIFGKEYLAVAPLSLSFDFDFDTIPNKNKQPREVAQPMQPTSSFQKQTPQGESWTVSDLFSVLSDAFSDVEDDPTENPYEPTPLPEPHPCLMFEV